MGGFSGQFNPSLLETRGLVASYTSPDPAADNIDEKMFSPPLFPFLTLPPPDNMDDLCFSSFIELFELFNTRRHQELSSSHNFR